MYSGPFRASESPTEGVIFRDRTSTIPPCQGTAAKVLGHRRHSPVNHTRPSANGTTALYLTQVHTLLFIFQIMLGTIR